MSRKAKTLLYSTAILGVLGATGISAMASSTHGAPNPLHRIKYFSRVIPARKSKGQVDEEARVGKHAMSQVNSKLIFAEGKGKVTEPYIKNYGKTSRFTGRHYATKSGSIDEGSPRHHSIPGIIANGHDYDISLGRFHSHLEAVNLSQGHRVIRIVNPQLGKKYVVAYPNSVILAMKKGKKTIYFTTTALLEVRPMEYYKPWRGQRSIVFSKDIDEGYMYNGFTKLMTSIILLDPRTAGNNYPKAVNLDHSWMFFRDVNGLSPYSYGGTLDGADAWRNNMEWVLHGNTNDHTGEYIENAFHNGQKQYSYAGARGLTRHGKRGIKNQHSYLLGNRIDGGAYDTPYNDDDGFNNVDHDIFFKLHGKSADFINGTSVGYGNFTPLFNTGITIHKPKAKPTLYHCHIDKGGKPVTNLTVGTKASRYQLSDGHKFSISDKQYHHIVNSHHKVTKHGLKYWEDNIMPCPVQPSKPGKPKHPTIDMSNPTKPVKYVTGVHPMSDINVNGTNYNDGGALSHPDQTYTYHITGYLPTRDTQNTPFYKYQNHYDKYGNLTSTTPYIDHYYDGNLNDYLDIHDKLPKYVKVLGVKSNINGATISKSNRHRKAYVNVHVDHDTWDANNGNKYNIAIKVQASRLPSLNPEQNHNHWTQMLNGGDNLHDKGGLKTDTYISGLQSTDNRGTDKKFKKYSNAVPTEIKVIKANIWHYDYNHDHQVSGDWFPDSDQPMGITNDDYNPNDSDFKNYRFHDNLTASDMKNGKGVLSHHSEYWYAGSHHWESTVNGSDVHTGNVNHDNFTGFSKKPGHYQYRLAYPSLNQRTPNSDISLDYESFMLGQTTGDSLGVDIGDMLPDDYDLSSSNVYGDGWETNSNGAPFEDEENWLFDWANPHDKHVNQPGTKANGDQLLYMNANPDGADNNAYSTTGFTQNDYVPYYVPKVSLDQHVNRKTGKVENDANDYRMVIDTDKAQHGLPFRLDMRGQNLLYGTNYDKDFKGVYVKMDITTNHGHDKLYSNIRPLASSNDNDDALLHEGTYHKHTHTLSESPAGDDGSYEHGYIEANALKKANDDKNYDLNTAPFSNQLTPGTGFPVDVHFTLTTKHGRTLSPAKQPDVVMRDINTHAFIANDPRVTADSFGNMETNTYDSVNQTNHDLTKSISNPALALFRDPERTLEYGDNHVRTLNEELAVNQPRKAVGKSGYGISANDLGISYMGHLEAPHYAQHGTNMQVGFPKQFNAYDSNISYDKDAHDYYASHRGNILNTPANQENEALCANLLHVKPFMKDSAPDFLDNDSGDVDADDDVDDMFDEKFPEHLHAGNFSTTYGFYPKATVRNNPTSANNEPQDNGNVLLSGDFAHGYGAHAKYHDAQFNNNEVNGFGLDTTTNVPHSNNPAKEAQIKANDLFTNLNEASDPSVVKNLDTDGQNERLFTPEFLQTGTYGMTYHRAYGGASRAHRLGGNFFNIDEHRNIKMKANQYLAKSANASEQNLDELSVQPILTNPSNGLMQTPLSSPAFNDLDSGYANINGKQVPTGWLTQNLWAGMYGNSNDYNNIFGYHQD